MNTMKWVLLLFNVLSDWAIKWRLSRQEESWETEREQEKCVRANESIETDHGRSGEIRKFNGSARPTVSYERPQNMVWQWGADT